jgi:hypothetical protein
MQTLSPKRWGEYLLFFSLCPLCFRFLGVLRVSAVKAFAFDSISNLKFPIPNRFNVHLCLSVPKPRDHLWLKGFGLGPET